jgi:hypothetical protein
MSEPKEYGGEQPDFAWIPEPSGLGKMFAGAKRKRAIADGTSLRVFVFPWGVSWLNGGIWTQAQWEDLTQVFQEITSHSTNSVATHTDYRYTLHLADGRSITFYGTLPARHARKSEAVELVAVPASTVPVTLEQLGRLLVGGVTRVQLPKAIERFNAGETVAFGPLAVSTFGISTGDESVPWSEIEGVQTLMGKVSVKKSGKWLAWKKADVGSIPNYFVFQAFVRAVLDQRGRS